VIEHSFSKTERKFKMSEDAKKLPEGVGPGLYNLCI